MKWKNVQLARTYRICLGVGRKGEKALIILGKRI